MDILWSQGSMMDRTRRVLQSSRSPFDWSLTQSQIPNIYVNIFGLGKLVKEPAEPWDLIGMNPGASNIFELLSTDTHDG